MPPLSILPTEILLEVGALLGDRDLAHLGQVNHLFTEIFSKSLIKRSLEDKPHNVKIPALHWAIHNGYKHLVQRIVTQPDFSTDTQNTSQALHSAAARGNPEIISILIGAGYDVDRRSSRSRRSRTPLHVGVMNGQAAVAKVLLENGAIIHAEDDEGMTAFKLAIESQWDLFRKCQPNRDRAPWCRVNKAPPESDIKLIYDVERRVLSTLCVLVEHGADRELLGADGDTPLHLAADCISPDHGRHLTAGTRVLRFLVGQGADMMARDKRGDYPIDKAISPHITCRNSLAFFLEMGVNPNLKDTIGATLLSRAYKHGSAGVPLVEVLLNSGATPGSIGDFLYYNMVPSELPCMKIFKLLLKHGAEFDIDADECFTLAAHVGKLEVMKLIFKKGGGVNTAACKIGQHVAHTPIQIAIAMRRKDMLRFLVKQGVVMSNQEKVQVIRILGRDVRS